MGLNGLRTLKNGLTRYDYSPRIGDLVLKMEGFYANRFTVDGIKYDRNTTTESGFVPRLMFEITGEACEVYECRCARHDYRFTNAGTWSNFMSHSVKDGTNRMRKWLEHGLIRIHDQEDEYI